MPTRIKLTTSQVEENVQKLMKTVFIGNGERSLSEMMRGTVKDIESFKNEVFTRLESLERKMDERDEAYRRGAELSATKEIDSWREKYENLAKRHEREKTFEKTNKVYWARTVISLILSQIVQWGFIWFFR